ncbi:hypothetical protein [Nocardia salmonicida]|uniref:hypothetical protein n=1 Tax=Nocardia salmonicida TaxID=53431 RepID=UPI0007A41207
MSRGVGIVFIGQWQQSVAVEDEQQSRANWIWIEQTDLPFRASAIALVRAGKQAKQTTVELDIHPVTLSKWVRQDEIDRGLRPGTSS